MNKRLSRLKELRALSTDVFLIELNKYEFQYEFAYQYGVTSSMISKEIQRREESITLEKYDDKSEDEICSINAWKNSPERKAYLNAGLMSNKSIKYNYEQHN